MKEKKQYKQISNNKKQGGTKSWTANQDLTEQHERFLEYVDLDFKEKRVPISDNEIRYTIRKSFNQGKYADLSWIDRYSDDFAYNNLIEDVRNSPQYLSAINKLQEDIKTKRRKYKVRKGIKINDKYYYKIIFPKNKEGKKLTPYRRFYSVTSGKEIKTRKANRYMDIFATEYLIEKRDAIAKMRKSKRNNESIKQKIKRQKQ